MTQSDEIAKKEVIFVDSREEMNTICRRLGSNDVVILRGTDPEIVDYMVNFEWTDEDEAWLQADLDAN